MFLTFQESIRKEAAFASSFKRGQKIARDGGVLTWSADYFDDGGSCSVFGSVAGSEGGSYAAWVSLDLGKESVIDYDCECPAQGNYAGMCKHAIALALTFLDSRGNPDVAGSDGPAGAMATSASDGDEADALFGELDAAIAKAEKRANAKLSAKAGGARAGKAAAKKPKKSAVKTSQKLLDLMSAQAAITQDEVQHSYDKPVGMLDGPVDLACTVALVICPYGYRYYGGLDDSYELRLRVERGKASYVVKDIAQLVYDWEDGSYRSYGKNLGFTHSKNVFTNRANQVLEFISGVVRAQRALYSAQRNRYYSAFSVSDKSLPLSSEDTIALLDLLMGSQVSFTVEKGSQKKPVRHLTVKRGVPDLAFSLSESADGSWLLEVPTDGEVIRCDKDMYVASGANLWRCEPDFVQRAGTILEGLLPGDGKPLAIAEKDVPIFCERLLGGLEALDHFEVPQQLVELAPPEAEFSFRIGVVDGCVTCTASVAYDEDVLPLFEDLAEGQPVRDIQRELEVQAAVRSYFPNGYVVSPSYGSKAPANPYAFAATYGTGRAGRQALGLGAGPGQPWFPEEDVEQFYMLLSEGLDKLATFGEVFLSERLRGVSVVQAPEIHVDASVRNGLLDLEIDASGMSPADLMDYLASYRRKQRYIRLSSGDIMRLGEGVRAISELSDGLGVSDDALFGPDGTGGQLPANRTLFVDALMKDASGVRFDRDEAFRSIVRSFDTVADSDFVEPDSLRNVLRGYQRTGFKWLSTLSTLGFGGILADDMGLGKTVQVIALLLARKQGKDRAVPAGAVDAGRALEAEGAACNDDGSRDANGQEGQMSSSLVVCPASLVYNWLAELARFAPELDAVGVLGSAAQRRAIIARAGEHDVLVTSYDLMKRDIDTYESSSFDIVVLDEAHYIKNHATKSAKSAKRLPAHVRFALTGTPIENRLSELWSIFDFLMPGILGSAESFAKRFAKPVEAGEEGASARLQKLVSPFILRRLKGDVLSDLPEKNESIVYAVMEGEQDKLYKANADKLALMLTKQMPEEFARNKIAVLAELTRLRQLCCDPHLVYENYDQDSAKLLTCMELVSSAVEGGHKILLFSQFTSMLDIIAERLRKERVSFFMLTGATSKEQRVRLVNDFQNGAVPVFLISLKAGGVGLNLTAADIVIHFDPWWNLSAQNQATDRAHRIGQTRDVSVFKLIAKGTIEEKIVQMQEAKRDLAESVIGGDGVSSSALTRDDVLALLDAGQ